MHGSYVDASTQIALSAYQKICCENRLGCAVCLSYTQMCDHWRLIKWRLYRHCHMSLHIVLVFPLVFSVIELVAGLKHLSCGKWDLQSYRGDAECAVRHYSSLVIENNFACTVNSCVIYRGYIVRKALLAQCTSSTGQDTKKRRAFLPLLTHTIIVNRTEILSRYRDGPC